MTRSYEAGELFDELLTQALRSGVGAAEFWQMTPAETFLVISAYLWRSEVERKEQISLAWLTARLIRAKKLPALNALLMDKKAKKLTGTELQRRRQEFREMTRTIDISKLDRSTGPS